MKDPSHDFWHPVNNYKTVIGVDVAIGKDMSSVVKYEKIADKYYLTRVTRKDEK